MAAEGRVAPRSQCLSDVPAGAAVSYNAHIVIRLSVLCMRYRERPFPEADGQAHRDNSFGENAHFMSPGGMGCIKIFQQDIMCDAKSEEGDYLRLYCLSRS